MILLQHQLQLQVVIRWFEVLECNREDNIQVRGTQRACIGNGNKASTIRVRNRNHKGCKKSHWCGKNKQSITRAGNHQRHNKRQPTNAGQQCYTSRKRQNPQSGRCNSI